MAIYKYLTSQAGLLYLANWKLRYSPRHVLNDPFEIDIRFRWPYFSYRLGPYRDPADAQRDWLPPEEDRLIENEKEMDERAMREQDRAKKIFFEEIGFLCFTRTRRHQLMWAHYAQEHSGLLLEFDDSDPCFWRRPRGSHLSGIYGFLGDVRYADERPAIYVLEDSSILDVAFTKSLDWAYEQEVRLLWPLAEPDALVQPLKGRDPILLFDVPPRALLSVTFGCLTSDATKAEVIKLLGRKSSKGHVHLQQATPDREEFRINYEMLTAGRGRS